MAGSVGNNTFNAGERTYKIKESDCYNNLPKAISKWGKETSGAHDFLSTLRKLLVLFDFQYAGSQINGFIGGAGIVRLCGIPFSLYNYLQEERNNKKGAYFAAKVTHDITDLAGMAAFSYNFLIEKNPLAVNVGIVMGTASAVLDIGLDSADVHVSRRLLASEGISDAGVNALRTKQTHALLKLAKSVMSAVLGFFASLAVWMKTSIMPTGLQAGMSLTSSFLNIIAFYQLNYASQSSTDLKPVPLAG